MSPRASTESSIASIRPISPLLNVADLYYVPPSPIPPAHTRPLRIAPIPLQHTMPQESREPQPEASSIESLGAFSPDEVLAMQREAHLVLKRSMEFRKMKDSTKKMEAWETARNRREEIQMPAKPQEASRPWTRLWYATLEYIWKLF